MIRWLAILMLSLAAVGGCARSADPPLEVRAVNYWSMPPDGTRIPAPRAVAIGQQGEVLVLDTAGRVLVFDSTGELLRQWAMPESAVGNPEGLCVLHDGRIAVADTHYSRLVFFDQQGRVLATLGEPGDGPGQFRYPVAVTQDPAGNLYVCEYGSAEGGENDRVQKFNEQGEFLAKFGTFGSGDEQFQRPSDIVWHEGRLYVADAINNRIAVFSDGGEYLGLLGTPPPSLYFPYDLALWSPPGGEPPRLLAVEYGSGRLTALSLEGRVLGRFGHTGTGPGQLNTPWGLAVDDQGRVRIADTGNRRIVELKL